MQWRQSLRQYKSLPDLLYPIYYRQVSDNAVLRMFRSTDSEFERWRVNRICEWCNQASVGNETNEIEDKIIEEDGDNGSNSIVSGVKTTEIIESGDVLQRDMGKRHNEGGVRLNERNRLDLSDGHERVPNIHFIDSIISDVSVGFGSDIDSSDEVGETEFNEYMERNYDGHSGTDDEYIGDPHEQFENVIHRLASI